MMTPKTQSTIVMAIFILIIIVAAILWPMKHEGSIVVLVTVGVMSAVWAGCRQLVLGKGKDWINSTTRREILFAMILAGALLLISITATLFKELDLIGNETVKRSSGVMIGVMLIIMGNYMPKKLTHSPCRSCCGSGGSLKTQRFVGWLFVVAGLLYAGVWLMVDLEQTSLATLLTFPVAIGVLVLVRFIYIRIIKQESPVDTLGVASHE